MPRITKNAIEKLKNTLDIADNFNNDLIRAIEQSIPKYTMKPNYKPSSLDCIRKMWFIMKSVNAESNESYQSVGILQSGSDRHLRLQKIICSNTFCKKIDIPKFIKDNKLNLQVKRLTEYEVNLYSPEYRVSFMLDGLIEYKDKIYILEIKTESNNKFYQHSKVREEHINQISTYSLLMKVPNILFIYENRDTLQLKSYLTTITNKQTEKIEKLIRSCDEYVEKDVIPPKSLIDSNVKCEYCNYISHCKGIKL